MSRNKALAWILKWLVIASLLLPWIGTGYSYISLSLIVGMGFFVGEFPRPKLPLVLYFTPLALAIAWVYGAVMGLAHGHPLNHIFRNFAGLAFYLIFYVLCGFHVSNKKIVEYLYSSSIFVLFYDGYLLISEMASGDLFLIVATSISDYRVKYDPAVLYFLPFVFSALVLKFGSFNLISSNKLFLNHMIRSPLIGAFIFVFIFLSMSKGFIAALLIIFAFASIYGFANILVNIKIRIYFAVFLLLTIIFIYVYNDLLQLIIGSFDSNESSNSIRSEQFNYIRSELSFLGKGFGAPLVSGYARNEETPYGFELSYFNLIHKLGFIAFVVLFSYLLVILYSIKFLFDRRRLWSGIFLLGMMAYLIPGYGNPIILSPNFVLIHCLCMVFIFNDISEKNKEG